VKTPKRLARASGRVCPFAGLPQGERIKKEYPRWGSVLPGPGLLIRNPDFRSAKTLLRSAKTLFRNAKTLFRSAKTQVYTP
jgi:hypothetical protein